MARIMTGKIAGLSALSLTVAMVLIARISANNPPKAGDVTESRVAADASEGTNWLLNGRTFDEGHFSPLKQINDQNASGLGLAWYLDVDSAMGLVSEPIVVDGVAYVSAPQSKGIRG
jgi:quinohemoprotein ethanol dehydrogenase